MDKETMRQCITKELQMKLGDGFSISIKEVLKVNERLDGLTISREGNCISPVIYLEDYYKDLQNGVSLKDVTDRIIEKYQYALDISDFPDFAFLLDFEKAKDRLFVKLINKHINRELLSGTPHMPFLDDFAVTVHCLVSKDEDNIACLLVDNILLQEWDVSMDAILPHAIENTKKLFGIKLMDVNSVLRRFSRHMFDGLPNPPFWIMTTKEMINGAVAALFDDDLKRFADRFGDFYVVFSSIHETLLMPVSSKLDINCLTKINQHVNKTNVLQEELLGTKVYLYSREKGFIF